VAASDSPRWQSFSWLGESVNDRCGYDDDDEGGDGGGGVREHESDGGGFILIWEPPPALVFYTFLQKKLFFSIILKKFISKNIFDIGFSNIRLSEREDKIILQPSSSFSSSFSFNIGGKTNKDPGDKKGERMA
jgi:hypothetical protein